MEAKVRGSKHLISILLENARRAGRTTANQYEMLFAVGACSVSVSYKPPMLVTRVRLPACAICNTHCGWREVAAMPLRIAA